MHDCDRPTRWRQYLITDEDCKLHAENEADLEAASRAARAGGSAPYSEMVPQIVSIEDFIAANDFARRGGRLLAIKFYSKRCRACMRIAAKYRKLAADFEGGVDFYEAEEKAARDLAEVLGVIAVPTLQIYHPEGVTKLSSGAYQAADVKKVDRRVRAALVNMLERPERWRKLRGESLSGQLELAIASHGVHGYAVFL